MIHNNGLQHAFTEAGRLAGQAIITVLKGFDAAAILTPDTAAGATEILKTYPGEIGQYFPDGTKVSIIRAAFDGVLQSLTTITHTVTAAVGVIAPSEPLAVNLDRNKDTLTPEQMAIINACVEFVRLSAVALLYWPKKLSNRETYEIEAQKARAAAMNPAPLTLDDEQAAAEVLAYVTKQTEFITQTLNIGELPNLDPSEINPRVSYLLRTLETLAGNKTTIPPKVLNKYWLFLHAPLPINAPFLY